MKRPLAGTMALLIVTQCASVPSVSWRPVLAAAAAPTPVLWRDPGNIAARDLLWGAASPDRAPRPPFVFLQEDASGSKPKIHVRDAVGRTWSVKFDRRSGRGREVPSEVAATRIAWGLGYFVEETYLVKEGVIEHTGALTRGRRVLDANGRFKSARFEPRPDDVERLDTRWRIDDNPFAGSKELSGLVALAALLNNWDFRAGNTTVLRVKTEGGLEDRYIVSDWGTAFGRMSPRRSRWNLEHYQNAAPFFAPPADGHLDFNIEPDDESHGARIPVEHARWFSDLASQLTERQLRAAFEAADATDAEVRGFAQAVARRIARLHAATHGK
ncbi:MAG: hypothetical protein AB7N65_14885 [Vicinamibacterales bacterium]